MRRFISRRVVYILSLLLTLVFVAYTLPALGELRSTLSQEYFRYKEFLFNLKKAKFLRKEPADERSVSEVLKSLGVEPESLYTSDTGVEINFEELPWRKVPTLIKELESRYTIVSFSAVDNTGEGLFEVRIVVR